MLTSMNEADVAISADINLASTWGSLGRAMGGAVMEASSLTCVSTGVPIAFFNGAFLHSPTLVAEEVVAEAVEFFAGQAVPWLLWVRDSVSPATLEAGRAAGLRDAGGPPAMGLFPITDSSPPPEDLTVEIATSTSAVKDHASVLRDGFGMPQAIVDRLISPRLLDDPSLAVFVGRVAGQPVSCSLLSVTGETAGVYNVATPPPFRGKRYGEAMTSAAIDEGARRGCTSAILQASEAGYPLYRRMGFVDLGRYVQLEGPPSPTGG